MPRRKSLFGTIGWLRKKLYSGLNGLVPMSPRFEKRDSLRRFGELTLPCQVILISSLALEKFSLLLDQVVISRRSLLPIINKLQVKVWINWIFSCTCTLWVVFGLDISIDKLCQKHLASYRFVLKIPYRRGFLMFFFSHGFVVFLQKYFHAWQIESILALAQCHLPRSLLQSLQASDNLVYETLSYAIFTGTTKVSSFAFTWVSNCEPGLESTAS